MTLLGSWIYLDHLLLMAQFQWWPSRHELPFLGKKVHLKFANKTMAQDFFTLRKLRDEALRSSKTKKKFCYFMLVLAKSLRPKNCFLLKISARSQTAVHDSLKKRPVAISPVSNESHGLLWGTNPTNLSLTLNMPNFCTSSDLPIR